MRQTARCVVLAFALSLAGCLAAGDCRALAGRLSVSSRQGTIAAAVAGLGIVPTGLWFCRPELENSALVQVLGDWEMEPIELHAVFAPGRAAKPSARAFADHLASELLERSPRASPARASDRRTTASTAR
jgi:DNA-binding transcriptional LysR family regulator